MVRIVCLRCEDLAKTYITHLDEYMDVIESRKLVNRVWPDLHARMQTAETNLAESWCFLSEHRSEHHLHRRGG